MATVTIDSVSVRGDAVTVTGSVDEAEVVVSVWRSHLDTLPTRAAKRAYVAAQLKATSPPLPVTIDLSGPPITV